MEGLLQIETGPKKGLFSLKSRKKFHVFVQGTTLAYNRDGESLVIEFTPDTIVETSPKTKRLITIKSSKGEWDLICPDAVSYGKWMDAIALIFRELHVDPDKKVQIVHAESETDDESSGSAMSSSGTLSTQSDSKTPRSPATPSNDNRNADASATNASDSGSKLTSSSSDENKSPSTPTRHARQPSEKPAIPSKPAITSGLSDMIAQRAESKSDSIGARLDSKPEIPAKPGRPIIEAPAPPSSAKVPHHATLRPSATVGAPTRPLPAEPSQSSPRPSTSADAPPISPKSGASAPYATTSGAQKPTSEPPSAPNASNVPNHAMSQSAGPTRAAPASYKLPSAGVKKGPRPSLPEVPLPSIIGHTVAGSAQREHSPSPRAAAPTSAASPRNADPPAAAGSLRLPLSGRAQSVGARDAPQTSPRMPLSPLPLSPLPSPTAPKIAPPATPTMPSPTPSPSTSQPSDAGPKKFIVWMPHGLKHASLFNPNNTVRSYLEKICRARENVTPDTFVAKTPRGTVIDINTPLSKLGEGKDQILEIFWDSLAPGKTMPPDLAIPSQPSSARDGSRPPSTYGAAHTALFGSDSTPVDHRTKVVREIIATEQSYVESLKNLHANFLLPILAVVDPQSKAQGSNSATGTSTQGFNGTDASDLGASASKTSIKLGSSNSTAMPTAAEIRSIVPKNFEAILKFNEMFCTELSACAADQIGAKFIQYMNFFKIYNDYSSDYQTTLAHYNKLVRDYPAFASKLEERRALSGSQLRVEDYVIMPVQRVPRYVLLIGELLKHTSATQTEEHAKLELAEKQMNEIATQINESVRKSNAAKRLHALEDKGVNVDRLITPSRFLVREGPIKVMEKGKKEAKHFFLFNDVLVHVKDSSMIKGVDLSLPEYMWPLNLIWVEESEQAFEMIGPNGATMVIKRKKKGRSATQILGLSGPNNTSALTSSEGELAVSWMKEITQRILGFLQRTDASLSAPPQKRFGVYRSAGVDAETYEGEWVRGLKQGNGRSVLPGAHSYDGQWENGKRHGKGVMYYANGLKYEGDWRSDLPNGNGSLSSIFPSTTIASNSSDSGVTSNNTAQMPDLLYTGSWVNGSPHGHGTMVYFPSLDKYVGDFYEGRCTGQGVLTSSTGVTYAGQWLDDQFDGRGEWAGPDGCTYTGQFRAGVKSGRGLMTYPDGSTYNGDWLDGCRHGRGEYKDSSSASPSASASSASSDGYLYDGEWVDDRQEGKGIKTWADGVKYEGSFSRGFRRGQGKLSFPNGAKYEGQWLDDLPHGHGIYIASDGSAYNGDWIGGRREGKGIQIYASQAKYDGTWHNDRFHKQGVFIGAPTDAVKVYDGEWLASRMVNKGSLVFANGDFFRAIFKDGRPHGAGTYTWASGASFTGKWNAGLREGKGTFTPPPALSPSGSSSSSSSSNINSASTPAPSLASGIAAASTSSLPLSSSSSSTSGSSFNLPSSSSSYSHSSAHQLNHLAIISGISVSHSSSEPISGNFEGSCNVFNTSSPTPYYLPPQQPLLFIAPVVEALRLPRR